MRKILIAGGSGLIGQEIIRQLEGADVVIHILSRSKKEDTAKVKYFTWDLEKQEIDEEALRVDSIINLTGAGIADGRWTEKRKKIIMDSRVESAELLQKGLDKINHRLESFVSASAIGYYGNSGERLMKEGDKPVDTGFLSTVTVQWELSAEKLKRNAERHCMIRVGIVLSNEGGAFEKMIIPFKARMATYFGDGSMYYSWIHIFDIAKIFIEATDSKMDGIYNGVAPEVVTNKAMIKSIVDIKNGFYIMNSVPAFGLRLAMGEMADVVLSSTKVSAEKLLDTGFQFKYRDLKSALEELLG